MRKFFYILICLILSWFMATDKTPLWENLSNNVFRIDIAGSRDKDTFKILKSQNIDFEKADWVGNHFYGADNITKNNVDIQIKGLKNDTIRIDLLGPGLRDDNNKLIPVVVTYKNLVIDGETVLSKSVRAWHDEPYFYKIDVKAGQILSFSVDVKKTNIFLLIPYLHCNLYMFVIYFISLLIACIMLDKFISKNKNKSILDIIFVVAFMIILFIPMSRISNAEIAIQENRTLAKMPHLINDQKINQKFGVQFDEWFNDRFFGRKLFVDMFYAIQYSMSDIYQNHKALFIKSNLWMFNKHKFGYPDNFDAIVDNLKSFNDFCKNNNMKLYVLIVPHKSMVYSDILKSYYGTRDKSVENFERYISDVQNVLPNDVIVYPYLEMQQAKEKDYVFFKQAHHWTDFGAYIGYKSLSKRIRQDFKDWKIVDLDEYNKYVSNKVRDEWYRDFNTGHTIDLLKLKNKADTILKVEYSYYDNKHNNVKETRSEYTKLFDNGNKKAKYKVFLMGDSQNENLLQFLPYSVKQLKFLRLNKRQYPEQEQYKFMKYYKQDLLDYKPDIVIISVSSTVFGTLVSNLYKD